jgi:hypothetical protein
VKTDVTHPCCPCVRTGGRMGGFQNPCDRRNLVRTRFRPPLRRTPVASCVNLGCSLVWDTRPACRKMLAGQDERLVALRSNTCFKLHTDVGRFSGCSVAHITVLRRYTSRISTSDWQDQKLRVFSQGCDSPWCFSHLFAILRSVFKDEPLHDRFARSAEVLH